MRTRSSVAQGDTRWSVATLGRLLVGGTLVAGTVVTTAGLGATDPLAPPASADSLQRFDGCPSLLRWYVDHAVDEVGPYGWDRPVVYGAFDDAPVSRMPQLAGSAPAAGEAGGKASDGGRASSSTGTNTQEADVDEPDL